MRQLIPGLIVLAFLGVAAIERPENAFAAPETVQPVTGDASGEVISLTLDSGRETGLAVVLRGRDATQQLLVTGESSNGQLRDLTSSVSYSTQPADIVQVDSTGLVTPLAEGKANVTATTSSGKSATLDVQVENLVLDVPVNFPHQVVPIFTKLGCNSGGCHGKASGQNGFKLSLLGFEPREDFEHLVKEARGRRLFPAAPDRSLLLLKPINAMPHGGGQRLTAASHEYRLLRRWITQGMPYGQPTDPTVERIEVFPSQRTMQRKSSQQIVVLAHYTNGSIEDVTRVTQFDSNDAEMAEVTPSGLVRTLDMTGDVAVMARYQGQVDVFRASLPLGLPVENLPPEQNTVDKFVFAKLKTLGLPPSPLADDPTFIRRATIDLAGRLPLPTETESFLADSNPLKREALVDRLLASDDYADYFANKWSAILRNKRRNQNHARGTFAFHAWIRDSLRQNKPFDQFVRSILAGSGDLGEHPPVVWYREVREINQQVEDTAQLFLGLRIQCARCHHHPFEKWSQRDYYGFAAFFSQVGTKPGSGPDELSIFHRRGVASATNPKTSESLKPTGLGGSPLELVAEDDPRQRLVEWMRDPANPYFARALVNRYWKHFFGRGIVDPEDDMRLTNPATNPELLRALADEFIASGFDMKLLVRTICTSSTYQLSAEPNDHNLSDKQNFSRYYPRRLAAEVLLDALDQVTNSTTAFSGLPGDIRAVELPDTSVNSYFLQVFGRPEGQSACECERSGEANLAQSLHLLNSNEVQSKLSAASGRAAQLAADTARAPSEKLRELYLWTFSRAPLADELAVAQAHIDKVENKQQGYEDILWALVNTKEFLFNH